MAARTAVIIGAGALGLGFLAERLARDYSLHVSDTSAKAEALRRLEAGQGFTVNICSAESVEHTRVSGSFTVSLTDTPEGRGSLARALAETDIVLTATGRRFLPEVVSVLRSALKGRSRKAWLLFCENGVHVAQTYGTGFDSSVIPADAIMSRMCRFESGKETGFSAMWPGYGSALVVEDYALLPLDAEQCGPDGTFSSAFTLLPHPEFALRQDMKFYIHNGIHAFVSYRAHLQGIRTYPDVPASLRAEARETLFTEVIPAILTCHPSARREEVRAYALAVLARIFNPFFNDSIERGIRGIEEKLDPSERLVSGCEYIRRAGIEPRGYEGTIAAARQILARRR